MNTKNNKKSKDTILKIEDTFISMLSHFDINKITVSALCEEANINRSTFYAHYTDIFHLLNKIAYKMNCKIASNFNTNNLTLEFFLSEKYYMPFLEHIKENKIFYKSSLKYRTSFPINEGSDVLFNNFIKPKCQKLGIENEEDMLYYFVYYQAGITMIIKRWVDTECKKECNEICSLILKFIQ